MKHFLKYFNLFIVIATVLLFNNCGQSFKALHIGASKSLDISPTPNISPALSPSPRPNTPTPTLSPVVDDGYFPADTPWYRDVTNAPVDSESSVIINWLASNGGWGTGRMQVDFSFHILTMDSGTPFIPVVRNSDYYIPDCDANTTFPLPAGGAIEGSDNYSCTGGDCHLLVRDLANKKIYESYVSNVVNGSLHTTCIAVWSYKSYPETLRGDQCTSTDAAGFPITPLLFTADEIAAGEIKHAIRFILPNARMRARVYVRPASHAGGPSGPAQAVPYGARLRLKSSFDVNRLNPAARVVARAMKKYGMLLADGGNIALTAASDQYTTAKWDQVGFGPRDLDTLQVTDFEMIEAGPRIPLTYDCVRNP